MDELDRVGFKEILDQDSRPTFILDLDSDYVELADSRDVVQPIFCNAALRQHVRLLDNVTGASLDSSHGNTASETTVKTRPMVDAYRGFYGWTTGKFNDTRDVFPLTCMFDGLLWTGSTIRQRWRIISGNLCYQVSNLPQGDLFSASPDRPPAAEKKKVPIQEREVAKTVSPEVTALSLPLPTVTDPGVAPSESKNTSNDTSGSGSSVTLASPESAVADWTAATIAGVLPEFLAFARTVNWASTPLGPMAKWSSEFRELVNLVMRNPHPCSLFWGEELTMLYNEAYKIEVAGNKHPELMGTGFSGPFSELWDGVAPIFRECARTGKSVRMENDPLPIERYGYLEETFFSWSFIPIYGGTDRILGFYNGPFETTYQTISSRRMQTLRYLGESLASARTVKMFWKCVLDGLEHNQYDVPFAILYSVADSDDADVASHSSDSTISLKSCLLEGVIGIPDGHAASPTRLDLKRSQEGFIPAFREAMRTREPSMLHTRDGSLPEALLEGIEWRGYGDPCREAIIIPIRPTNGETIFAFLLLGVNPRRAYDDEYKTFAAMLNRQLATSLASVMLFEEEVRRSKQQAETAALQRAQLSQQLELQTSRMRRMTELSPLGMYLFSPGGVLLEANDRFYEMSGFPRDDEDPMSFMRLFTESSKNEAEGMWTQLVTQGKACSAELQLVNPKIQPRDLTGEVIEYWVLASSQAEIGMDGQILSIMGSISDISHMKWAQGLQDRRLREAEETKRQQNEFMDITSHEMRNPLSAILICADDIRDTLSEHQFADSDRSVISDCLEAANNIALCVQHQKSIVDDILTVSKLDSNLLLITPVPAQPVAVIQRAMSMFKPEVQAKDIQFEFCTHEWLNHHGIDWVLLDPSRLLQITVNLITNAIKFTQGCPKRMISVHLSASKEQPDLKTKGFEFVPTRGDISRISDGDDWDLGELLYIRVEVEDTGCGLTKEEKELLFERFAQASPRTHAHYGGTGLGLFISRQLAELHGGQIGVSSEAGVGSIFGFIIQAKSIAAPPKDILSRRQSAGMGEVDHAESSRALGVSVAKLELDPPVPRTAAPTTHLHILIVEDNLINQKVMSKQLQKAGCTVSTADNGLFALDHLKTTEFQRERGQPLDIILMDLEMPEMDGLTCVGRIREMEVSGEVKGHVPVIAVTANVRGEQIAAAKASGMDDVVPKPFRVPELLATMHELLDRLARG
ncbi:hypothetical protein P154DRAFT_444246 [Amniculicola lignicola CBS 123094]|uniref:Aerobic respiration control sensor protein arcB n=1 Tax=Amniculicola lignicola CBS 123094 TaxID=1392246 RepID=A0A6A5WA59_9PLEO|nr:hypothetical protein P154DRAFT_444246 [Amniculicola lignicola CBS 123094]